MITTTRLQLEWLGLVAISTAFSAQLPTAAGQESTAPYLESSRPVSKNVDRANFAVTDLDTAPAEFIGRQALLELANAGLTRLRQVNDHSGLLIKRERINGRLGKAKCIHVKIRHEPYSVYLRFEGPSSMKGQEAIYVDGQNDGRLLGHAGSGLRALVGTLRMEPTDPLAMQGTRYPITDVGLLRLAERLIAIGEEVARDSACDVKVFPGAKIKGRTCSLIECRQMERRPERPFCLAQVYFDDELKVPLRYAAYDWPDDPEGEPILSEEFTYINLSFDNGFTDRDFDIENPEYGFSPLSAARTASTAR